MKSEHIQWVARGGNQRAKAKGKQLGRQDRRAKTKSNSRRSKTGQRERHGNTEKLSCRFILSRSSVSPPIFVQCITLLLCQHLRVATHVSLLWVPTTSHAGKSLTTHANLLPHMWSVLYFLHYKNSHGNHHSSNPLYYHLTQKHSRQFLTVSHVSFCACHWVNHRHQSDKPYWHA